MKVFSSYHEDDPKKTLLVIIVDGVNHSKKGILTEKYTIALTLANGLLEYKKLAEEKGLTEVSSMAERLFGELYKSIQYEVSDYDTLVEKARRYL